MATAEGGTRILGPNCLGVINASENLDATISRVIDPKKLKSGNIAFVSQSGAFAASLYSWAHALFAVLAFFSLSSLDYP